MVQKKKTRINQEDLPNIAVDPYEIVNRVKSSLKPLHESTRREVQTSSMHCIARSFVESGSISLNPKIGTFIVEGFSKKKNAVTLHPEMCSCPRKKKLCACTSCQNVNWNRKRKKD